MQPDKAEPPSVESRLPDGRRLSGLHFTVNTHRSSPSRRMASSIFCSDARQFMAGVLPAALRAVAAQRVLTDRPCIKCAPRLPTVPSFYLMPAFPTRMGRPHFTIGATAFHSEFGMGSGWGPPRWLAAVQSSLGSVRTYTASVESVGLCCKVSHILLRRSFLSFCLPPAAYKIIAYSTLNQC